MRKSNNKAVWGEDVELIGPGPRDWFRISLLFTSIIRRFKYAKVLDFGCGPGHLIDLLAARGFKVTGIDSSDSVIKFLENRFAGSTYKNNVIFNKKLTMTERNFDVIIATEVLEHMKNDLDLVKLFYKLLKNNGICVVSVPAQMSLWDVNDEYSGHFRRYDKQGLRNIFNKADFKIEEVYYYGFPVGRLWHKYIFLPFIKKKAEQKTTSRSQSNVLKYLFSKKYIVKLSSLFFYIDKLFKWSERGNGLILVARK